MRPNCGRAGEPGGEKGVDRLHIASAVRPRQASEVSDLEVLRFDT